MQGIRSIAALILFFSLCRPVFGQYMDAVQNISACLQRNEYAACDVARRYSDAVITPEQRRQIEAKIQDIQAGRAKQIPRPAGTSPRDDLEKGFRTLADGVGTVFEIIFFLVIAILGFVFLKKMMTKAEINAGAPDYKVIPGYDEGPMKVDISFQQIPAPNQKHRIYGGDNWWRMHMNIRMSNKDWALFQKSGLMENELFACHNAEFPEIEESFLGYGLKWMPAHRDFPNISRAEHAKETLIKQLHFIRARLDDMKSSRDGGVDRETLEI